MNPTHDISSEEEQEHTNEQDTEEHITRHSERNDTYREVISSDSEDMVQPPLEVSETGTSQLDIAKEAELRLHQGQHEVKKETISEENSYNKEQVVPVPERTTLEETHEVYHTVSGGPETMNDMVVKNTPLTSSMPPAEIAALALESPPQKDSLVVEDTRHIGFFITTGVLLLIVVLGVYVYFFQVELFRQSIDAMMIVKNQLLQK